MREVIELLGCDHTSYGELTVRSQADGRTAAGICVGGEYVRVRKGDLPVPNEDACGAIDEGDHTLLVVADSHDGHLASHLLCQRVLAGPIPTNPLALLEQLASPADPTAERDHSATTLLVAVFSRSARTGFGVTFGDSSLVVVSRSAPPIFATRKEHTYVSPWEDDPLAPGFALEFEFTVPEDGLAVAFSDGIDECCYNQPERSIQPDHLWGILAQGGGPIEPKAYVEALGGLALVGVSGYPGGQDNLSVVATR